MNNARNQIKCAENEARVLMNYAMALSKASMSEDKNYRLLALDNNLKLWVEIESSLKSAKNLLPQDIKDNLLKLSKYVERITLSKGVDMNKTDFDSLININMQISEGLLESVKNSLAKEEAFSLLKCAVDLSSARESNNKAELVSALNNNLKLWVYIKTMANSKGTALPLETRNNLLKLAEYVSSKTIELGQNMDNLNDKALDTMIMTNLQISEGLISNQKIA